MVANQSASGLNQGRTLNFWWLRSENYEVYRRIYNVYVLVKCLQIGKIWVCYYEPELKRQFVKWKHTDSPVKKKFQTQQSIKNIMLTVFRDIKGHIIIDFVEKGATVNSASYCLLQRQNSLNLLNDSLSLSLSLYVFLFLFLSLSLYIYIYI